MQICFTPRRLIKLECCRVCPCDESCHDDVRGLCVDLLLQEGRVLGHLLLNDRDCSLECVSTTSTSSPSDSLKAFAPFALTAFAAVNSESDDVLGYLVLDVLGLGCSFCLGSVSHRTPVFGLVATIWFALPAVGYALLAWCWLCSSACYWLCSSRFLSSFLQIGSVSVSLQSHFVVVYCFEVRLTHIIGSR